MLTYVEVSVPGNMPYNLDDQEVFAAAGLVRRLHDVIRPGLVGVSIVWKRGWTHAEGHHSGEADHASLQP